MEKLPFLPNEERLVCDVFIDESSQTKFRYLVLGGLLLPYGETALLERAIAEARSRTIIPIKRDDGTPRVMKWEKVSAYNFEAYKTVIDTFKKYVAGRATTKPLAINCLIVDTHKRDQKRYGEGNPDIGYDKELYRLCMSVFRKRYQEQLFRIFLDRRQNKRPLFEMLRMMELGAIKYGDPRAMPFRSIAFDDPEERQALQLVDIVIGSLAFRLNGHYDKPEAKAAKKALHDHIAQQFRLPSVHARMNQWLKREITWMHSPAESDE